MLEAAREEFERVGFEAANLRAIAARAGCPPGRCSTTTATSGSCSMPRCSMISRRRCSGHSPGSARVRWRRSSPS
ncbi:helix-turn-helix domain-containing protein [Archangium sp.]|uniref:helix-turn-helix domain-containing protein n=1 Tax=Archangium sp. TaxID=1872627 RepID=UPI0039C87B38